MATTQPDTAARLMADLKDTGLTALDFGHDNSLDLLVEIDLEGYADIQIAEPLAFHAERAGDAWRVLVDEGGYLTTAGAAKVVAELTRLITAATGLTVDIEHADYRQYDDEPTFGVSILTDYRPDETLQQWTDRIGWPVMATYINVTDPGTFGSPYLFDAVVNR
jgi:hypothetical protein